MGDVGKWQDRRKVITGRRSGDKLAGLISETVSADSVAEIESLLEQIKSGQCNAVCFVASTPRGVTLVRLCGDGKQNRKALIEGLARLLSLVDEPKEKENNVVSLYSVVSVV